MTNVLALLLLAVLAGIVLLLYREYRKSRTRRLPIYTEALTDLLDGRREAAFAKLKETVNQDSDNVDAYLRLADLLNQRGQGERASQIYQRLALRRNLAGADEQKISLALAREHLRAKRVNKAISVLEHMGELDQRDTVSRELLLFVYADNERWDDVKSLMKTLLRLQKDKRRAALYCTEIGARIYAKEQDAAAGYFQQALQLDGKSVAALTYAGDALYLQGKMDEAVEKWKQALARKPELSFMVAERMEKAFYETGRYEEMIKVYEELIAKSPEDPALYAALSRIYAKKGDVERARSALNRLPVGKQDDAEIRLLAAHISLDEGKADEARKELAKVEEHLIHKAFRCSNCGFLTEGEFLWYCPRCSAWETFKADRQASS
jgi:lipopolysaccharide biosynthesis regulator YciM